MTHKNHELFEEFPDKVDKIHELKLANQKFAQLYDAYHDCNQAILRAEAEIEPTDDFHLEDMKKQRLALMDEIATILAR